MKKSRIFWCIVFAMAALVCCLIGCAEESVSSSSSIEEVGREVVLDKTCVTVKETESVTLSVQDGGQDVVWTSSDCGVATVQNGVVTPLNAGCVEVTASNGEKSATCSIVFMPTDGALPLYKNRVGTFRLVIEQVESITAVQYYERDVAFTFDNKVLEIDPAYLMSGESVLNIETVKGGENAPVLVEMDVCDFAIGSAVEFNDFGSYIAQNGFNGKKAVLTADIDYQNAEWSASVAAGTRTFVNGTWDGRGHTISNLKIEESFSMRGQYGLFDDCENMRLTNIAFINIRVAGSFGIIARNMKNAYVENVHVKGRWTVKSAQSDGGGALAYYAAGVTGKNLLVEVEMDGDINPQTDPYEVGYGCDNHAIAGFGMQLLENVYAMSMSSNGHYSTWCDFPENGALYDRYEWFLEAQEEIITVFNSPYWKMVDGLVCLVALK